MVWLIIYLVVIIGIGIFDYIRSKNFEQYVVAGRSQNGWLVTFSLLATILGGSATVGMINMGFKVGFPAFWWLGVGALGLLLQGFFLTRKVREMEAYTLPDVVQKTMGRNARILAAVIIIITWVGIIAAQFVAASSIISAITGNVYTTVLLVITGVVMIAYTLLGGQRSILKTDTIQFILITVGLIYAAIYLFAIVPVPSFVPKIELLNTKFNGLTLAYFIFLVGGSYFIGPDMFSRIFTAKDGKTARRSSFVASFILIAMAILISLLGVWAQANITPDKAGVLAGIVGRLPQAGGMILLFGLLSAVISSADTCLITSAAILENDIFEKQNTMNTRYFVAIIGALALGIALVKPDIIGLLLLALSTYTPGIVMPLFVAIMVFKKKNVRKGVLFSAIITGAVIGFVANFLPFLISKNVLVDFLTTPWGLTPTVFKYVLALTGMGISLIIALLGVDWKSSYNPKSEEENASFKSLSK